MQLHFCSRRPTLQLMAHPPSSFQRQRCGHRLVHLHRAHGASKASETPRVCATRSLMHGSLHALSCMGRYTLSHAWVATRSLMHVLQCQGGHLNSCGQSFRQRPIWPRRINNFAVCLRVRSRCDARRSHTARFCCLIIVIASARPMRLRLTPAALEVLVSPLHLAMVRVQSGVSPSVASALAAAVKSAGPLAPWNGAWAFALKVTCFFALERVCSSRCAGNVLYAGPSGSVESVRAILWCQNSRARFGAAVLHFRCGGCGWNILCSHSNQNLQVINASADCEVFSKAVADSMQGTAACSIAARLMSSKITCLPTPSATCEHPTPPGPFLPRLSPRLLHTCCSACALLPPPIRCRVFVN